MDKPKVASNRPIVQTVEPGTYWWCACGLSKDQPFCDGSHKGTSFSPTKVEVTETKKIAWCCCKHGEDGPYCDGSHKLH